MTERYNYPYAEQTVYASVIELLRRYRLDDGQVVIDVGCGFGPIAEVVRDAGLTYIGFDVNPEGFSNLAERGFEAELIGLAPGEAVGIIEKRLAGRRLAAIAMVDSLEHMSNGPELLAKLHELAQRNDGAPLILAVPNATHFDLAAKQLIGRWDVTHTGLLDDTHVSFFSESRLREVTEAAGWVQIASNDFDLAISDQHFPDRVAALQRGAPLHDFLFHLRDSASSGGAIVNEFVRAYAALNLPAEPKEERNGQDGAPLISILMRTMGNRPEPLQDALLSLAAQSSQDFEVLLLAHNMPRESLTHLRYLVDAHGEDFGERVRIIPVDGGGRSRPLAVGVDAARGHYIAILDDDDVVFGHWMETFERLDSKYPGRVLRSPVAEQDVQPAIWSTNRTGYEIVSRPRCRWPEPFDVLDHLHENHSPPCGYALPRTMFSEHGLRFDERLPVLEDWDVLMQSVLWCGVADSGEVTALWRRWHVGDSSTSVHTEHEWTSARTAVLAKLDALPLLLPSQSVTALSAIRNELAARRAECDALRRELAHAHGHSHHYFVLAETRGRELSGLRASTSWKLTKPIRVIGSILRRATVVRRTDRHTTT